MPAGRPPDGVRHVDRLEGPRAQKERLRVILETLTGERSVAEACEVLGVSMARFHALRRQALQGALEALAPRPRGRPAKDEPAESRRVAELEHELSETQMDLQAALVRTELALAMPHLVKDAVAGKKNATRSKVRKKRRRKT